MLSANVTVERPVELGPGITKPICLAKLLKFNLREFHLNADLANFHFGEASGAVGQERQDRDKKELVCGRKQTSQKNSLKLNQNALV